MMGNSNNLNSVILEGYATNDPVTWHDFAMFSISSKWDEDDSVFSVMTVKGMVTDSCLKVLKKGRNIRIVGYLKKLDNDNEVYIIAQHIEYRPIEKGRIL